ncbi:MAG: universal stress protein [Chloroflexota bacterium]
MKAIFATDLRPSAESTRALLTGLAWPAGTTLEVLHVLPLRRSAFFGPARAPTEETLALTRDRLSAVAAGIAERLQAQRVTVHDTTRVGDAAGEIVRRAEEIRADLVIIGSPRRDGLIYLGSVATSLIDRAPCSVLIARTEAVGRLLLADDGSPSADVAAEVIGRWPMFSSLPVAVVSVLDMNIPVLAGPHSQFEQPVELSEPIRARASELVDRRVAQLRSSGRLVQGLIREGAAATELLRASRILSIDLLVLGCSSRFGLTRLLLGSVARSVVLESDRSVLIARAS